MPIQGQWWSHRDTQLSQVGQCEARGGLMITHVVQNFNRKLSEKLFMRKNMSSPLYRLCILTIRRGIIPGSILEAIHKNTFDAICK